MQTNILGPKKAKYVIMLTDLTELTKKETAILLACVQEYYLEAIYRVFLALKQPHGEDELAFLACVLTQFYHKVEIEVPEMLLDIANMQVDIVEETTDQVMLFVTQINKGFRGRPTDEISQAVRARAEARTEAKSSKLGKLAANDLDHIRLAILAEELCNASSFTMALIVFKMAIDTKSNLVLVDDQKWQQAKIFAKAYQVGSLIKAVNKDLPESESEIINQLHKVMPLHQLERNVRLRREREQEAKKES